MKIRNALVALMLVVALVAVLVSTVTADDSWSSWTATPTATAQGTSPDWGFGVGSTNWGSVTASSTALSNVFAALPSNDFDYALIKVIGSSKTVYMNTTATTTNGIALTDSMPPMFVPLPRLPKDRAKMYIIGGSGGEVVKIVGYRIRPQ